MRGLVLCAAEALAGHTGLFPERAAEYGILFRTMLEWGCSLSGATVARAALLRADWVGRFAEVFEEADMLACPSASTVTLPAVAVTADGEFTPEIAPFMRFTAPMNFSGHPTLSIPYGSREVPDSLQLVGRHGDEAALCRLGHAFEQAAGRPEPPVLGR